VRRLWLFEWQIDLNAGDEYDDFMTDRRAARFSLSNVLVSETFYLLVRDLLLSSLRSGLKCIKAEEFATEIQQRGDIESFCVNIYSSLAAAA
jgi:hypothetical protein